MLDKTKKYSTMNQIKNHTKFALKKRKLKGIHLQNLDKIYAGRFLISIRFMEKAQLPPYKGSTIRGAFGNAFRRATCITARSECASCLLRETCVYSYVFETPIPENTDKMRLYTHAPHPFIIEPPLDTRTQYNPGDTLSFHVTLIGKAFEYLPYFVLAFMEMGQRGLGRHRAKYVLTEVWDMHPDGKTKIYDSQSEVLGKRRKILFSDMIDGLSIGDSVQMEFITPTRIQYKGRITQKLDFHVILRNLLRRIGNMMYFHCQTEPDIKFKDLISRSEDIRIAHSTLSKYSWQRYSSRQDRKMSFDGMTGTCEYQGDLEPFSNILKIGEYLHVGKATAFGLGKYRIMQAL